MIVSEIHKAFKVMMDKNAEAVAFGGCPAFLPEEIDLFLNQAFIEIISNKFTGQNVLQTPFEGSVKRVADLEGLVKTDKGISLALDSSTNVLTLENFSNTGKRMFKRNSGQKTIFNQRNRNFIIVVIQFSLPRISIHKNIKQ